MNIIRSIRNITLLSAAFAASIASSMARDIYPLNNDWRIFYSSEGSGDRSLNIALPHSWSLNPNTPINLSQVNYLRKLYAPSSWSDQRVFLKFYGAQNSAALFVNGHYVGEHRGGSTAFSFEITEYLEINEDNDIMVRVSSAPQSDILPTSVEHEIYGGITRDVEVIVTPQTAISPVFYGSDGVFVTTNNIHKNSVEGSVSIRFISPEECQRRLEVFIYDGSDKQVFKVAIPHAKISSEHPVGVPFEIKNADIWSPENPALYKVTAKISSVSTGKAEIEDQRDEISVTTGFRSISLAPDGRAFGAVRINEKPILIRGVSLYHDHPATALKPSKRAIEGDIRVVKDLGANAVRSAIVPHDSHLYSICDREGLMVWVDTPLARAPYLSDVAYYPTKRFEDNGISQMQEVVYQNYNHPSIIMWGLFTMLSTRGDNFIDYLHTLNDMAHNIDPTRPTVAVSNQNGDLNTISDLIVWQQDIGWRSGQLSDLSVWSEQLHSKWGGMRSGVMYGEGGCVDHQIDRSQLQLSRIQNREGWFPEVRQSAMHEEYAKQLTPDSLFWGTWSTALFDFKSPRTKLGENVEGFVSYDRTTNKDAYYLYRALWNTKQPTLHIADKRASLVGDGEMSTTLRVYASGDEAPIATIMGKKHTMTKVAPAQYILENVKIIGRTKVVVEQGGLKDEIEYIYNSPIRNVKR